jgi:hypothetical protein
MAAEGINFRRQRIVEEAQRQALLSAAEKNERQAKEVRRASYVYKPQSAQRDDEGDRVLRLRQLPNERIANSRPVIGHLTS